MLTLDVDELLGEEWEKSLLTLVGTPVNAPADLPLCHGGLPRIYAQLWPCPFSVFTPAGGFLMLERERERSSLWRMKMMMGMLGLWNATVDSFWCLNRSNLALTRSIPVLESKSVYLVLRERCILSTSLDFLGDPPGYSTWSLNRCHV